MLNKTWRVFLILPLVLISLCIWSNSTRANNQKTVLVQIDIRNNNELEQFHGLDLPILTQLWGDHGEIFLLTLLDQQTYTQLINFGFQARILDKETRGSTYHIISKDYPAFKSVTDPRIVVLNETNKYMLVKADSLNQRSLTQSGYEVKHLTLHPHILTPALDVSQRKFLISPNPNIQSMIDQVSSDSAYDYIGSLSGEWAIPINGNPYTLNTRYSYAEVPIKKATKFVYDHFRTLGLTTYYDTFLDLGPELRNVIGEQRGLTNPDCIILLVGHLDSRASTHMESLTLAPGSDDNASGSTGVIIAADILHQYRFACTIRYILFTGEEQGMFGSEAYAANIFNHGDNVEAVINLDMIGFNSDDDLIIGFHTRPDNAGDLAIANAFIDVIHAFSINLEPEIVPDNNQFSDHASFWDFGYSAVLSIEDFDDFTPDYHKTTDTISTLDFSYLTSFIQAAVGTTAHLAGYIPPDQIAFFPLIITSE